MFHTCASRTRLSFVRSAILRSAGHFRSVRVQRRAIYVKKKNFENFVKSARVGFFFVFGFAVFVLRSRVVRERSGEKPTPAGRRLHTAQDRELQCK